MKARVCLLVSILGLSVLLGAVASAQEPYKVGAVFAVTGPASFLGEPEKKSVLMIEEQINAAGGINGHPLKVIVYDTESDETKTVLAVKKLIEKDNVLAIVGPSQSGTTLAVIPIVEKAQMPLISCAAAVGITEPVKKWVFKTPQTDTDAARKIYEYMNAKGISKVAIITVSTGFGDSGRTQLKKLAPEYGITIVADETYGPRDTDMTAQLTKIRATDAQALVNWSIGPPQVIVVRNARQLGIKIPIFQSHGFASKKNVEMLGEAAEGILFPAGRVVIGKLLPDGHPQKETAIKYKEDYESKYGEEISTFGGHAWDALMLVVTALKAVGPDREKIRDYIENIKGFPGTGGIFNYSPNDHYGLNKDAFEMIKVVNGDWSLEKY
ncbi:MAG: ABC transporter substrate-binding protein [bacterium]